MIRATIEHRPPKRRVDRTLPKKASPAIVSQMSGGLAGLVSIEFAVDVQANPRVVPNMIGSSGPGVNHAALSIVATSDTECDVQFDTALAITSVRVDTGEPCVHTDSGGPIPPGTYSVA